MTKHQASIRKQIQMLKNSMIETWQSAAETCAKCLNARLEHSLFGF
jgi:hypothetical protein